MKLTCFRISNHALDGKALPSRIKVLSWGDNPSIKTINPKVTTRTISALPDFQRKRGRDRVALDYEHNTVPGTAEFDRTSEPRKVAAYGVVCVVEGDGLYLDDLLYTPSGIANAGEYIDLSVAANLDEKTGEVLGVHSVALTRAGAVEDVHFFSIEEPQQKGSHMDIETLAKQVNDLATALAEIKTKIEGMKPADASTFSATLQELEGKLTQTFSTELDKRDKQGLLTAALQEGKDISPFSAETIGKLTVKELEDTLKKLPATVPLHRRTNAKQSGEGLSKLEQFNAIEDPTARSQFYSANREDILAGK
jgi:hypothetical protein